MSNSTPNSWWTYTVHNIHDRFTSIKSKSVQAKIVHAYLLRMQLLLPLIWEIVGELHYFHHEHLRVEYSVILRNHSSCHGEYTTENADVEKDCSMRRNLEMEENVWIEDRSQD